MIVETHESFLLAEKSEFSKVGLFTNVGFPSRGTNFEQIYISFPKDSCNDTYTKMPGIKSSKGVCNSKFYEICLVIFFSTLPGVDIKNLCIILKE